MSASVIDGLQAARRHLNLVHHVPGRLRLRIGAGIFATLGGDRREALGEALQAVDGIDRVEVNARAASVTVHYDPRRLSPGAWETLLEGSDEEALALLKGLVPTLIDQHQPDEGANRNE